MQTFKIWHWYYKVIQSYEKLQHIQQNSSCCHKSDEMNPYHTNTVIIILMLSVYAHLQFALFSNPVSRLFHAVEYFLQRPISSTTLINNLSCRLQALELEWVGLAVICHLLFLCAPSVCLTSLSKHRPIHNHKQGLLGAASKSTPLLMFVWQKRQGKSSQWNQIITNLWRACPNPHPCRPPGPWINCLFG